MISKTTCTGCGACYCVCPTQSIEMITDKIGQLIPKVNNENCINCGLCEKTCPQNHTPTKKKPHSCFAAWSKNENDYIFSASGGAAASFSRTLLNIGWAVFGCDYDEQGNLFHFRIFNEIDIAKTQSSKYSQSSAYVCFNEILELLENNIRVMFIGTPCQVSALLNFLKKDYDSLITVDLVCHGTPPNIYLKEYIKDLKYSFPLQKIRFRGEHDQMLSIWKDNQLIYKKVYSDDLYFSAFYKNIISYNACYNCHYAEPTRVSDITIGDFWGLGELTKIRKMSNRPSLILINTKKGTAIFELLKNDLILEKRDTLEGINGNGRLMSSPGKNQTAELFQSFYKLGFSFSNSVKLSLKSQHAIQKYRNFKCKVSNIMRK